MKKFVLPLTLLASISTLTSCTHKDTVTPGAETTPTTSVETVVTPEMVSAEPTVALPTPPITRTETVTYATPAGNDPVEFSVSMADGVITSVTVNPKATNDISKKLQTSFAGEVSAKVVGKKASDLEGMSAIGGASLTTGAFKTFVQAM